MQESLIYKWIYGLFAFLGKSYKEGMISLAFRKCGAFLKVLFANSSIAGFARREGLIDRTWEASYAFRFVNGLINLPTRIFHPLFTKIKPALQESFIIRVLKLLLGKLHLFVALFLFVELILPHKFSENKYSAVIIFILLLLYYIKTITKGHINFNLKIFNVFLVIFIFCMVLGEIFSIMPAGSLRFLALYFTCFMLVLVIMFSADSRQKLQTIIVLTLAGLSLSGLYGIYQYVAGVAVNTAWIDPNINEGNLSRVYSVFFNPNNFAELIILLSPFYAAVFFNSKGWFKKLLLLALAVPPLIALLLTLSRSGWIAFAAAAMVFVFFKEKRLIPVFILIGILAFPFLPQSIINRIRTIANPGDNSTVTRVNILKTVIPILKDYWFSGLGLGNETLMKVSRNYYSFLVKNAPLPSHSHNLYLQIWLEMGIAGILSFLAFMGSTLKKTVKAVYSSKDKFINNLLIAGISSMAGILVMGLVEYVWFYPRVMLFFWVVIGFLLAALGILKKESDSKIETI